VLKQFAEQHQDMSKLVEKESLLVKEIAEEQRQELFYRRNSNNACHYQLEYVSRLALHQGFRCQVHGFHFNAIVMLLLVPLFNHFLLALAGQLSSSLVYLLK